MLCERQLAHPHRRFAATLIQRGGCALHMKLCIARYQTEDQKTSEIDPLECLVEQASQAPVVNLPGTAAAVAQQSPQRHKPDNMAFNDHHRGAYRQINSASGIVLSKETVPRLPTQQQQMQELAIPLQQRKCRPSRMDFEAMYQQLSQWKSIYLNAHVPRYCFDAPELGAWVRHMRKQHKDGQLELWKVERLNLLEFEWELTDQDAKWHYKYHQLRRYKLLHGTTHIDPGSSSADHCDWMMVARWLNKQARLLAKRKLSGQKRAMLEQLGVTLKLPKRLVHRTAQLQALNGMERRKLRKKWKAMDLEAAEQRRQQQRMEWELQLQQQRQQQWLVNRRLMLLQSSQIENEGSGVSGQTAAGMQQQQQWVLDSRVQMQEQQSLQCGHRQQQQVSSTGPTMEQQQNHQQQQQAQWQGLLLQQQEQLQLQLGSIGGMREQLQQPVLLAGHHTALPAECPSNSTDSAPSVSAAVHLDTSSAAAAPQLMADTTVEREEAGLQQQDAQQADHRVENHQQQQQQQNQALFWQQNRRRRKARQKSRQEKWLQAQQAEQQ